MKLAVRYRFRRNAERLRSHLARARFFRGHGVHSPFVYAIVRQVFMKTELREGDRSLYAALRERGVNERRAVQLQNLFIHCGYNQFGMNRATEADLCIATADTPTDRLPQLAEAARREGATLCIMEPYADVERRNCCRRLAAEHPSTSIDNRGGTPSSPIDNRGYLLLFNGTLPKQHFKTMTKVYTKTGDKGTTSLVGGERVEDRRAGRSLRTVDELGSFTAYLSDHLRSDEELAEYLGDLDRVASQLMSVAALLAVGHGGEGKLPDISPEAIGYLEERIDAMQSRVRPITKFTIPGGHPTVSLCHVCRTVCRRAERASLRAAALHPTISANTLAYLNRLSDYLLPAGGHDGFAGVQRHSGARNAPPDAM